MRGQKNVFQMRSFEVHYTSILAWVRNESSAHTGGKLDSGGKFDICTQAETFFLRFVPVQLVFF